MKIAALVLALAMPLAAGAQQRPPAQQPQPNNGRFVIVFSPYARADTYLLDTQTGAIWRPVTFTDAVGEPEVWIRVRREDKVQPFIPKSIEEFDTSGGGTSPR